MLTPAEITGKEFKRALFSGYEMAGVDDFLEEVLADYTDLYKENGILKNKLKVLVEKIEEYRSTEDSMRMALLTAQKTGEEIVLEARKNGEEISERMENEAETRRAELENEIADERARLDAAARETERFVAATKELITVHMSFLSKLSSIKREPAPPAPEPTREEEIRGAAREIDSAVGKLVSPDAGREAKASPETVGKITDEAADAIAKEIAYEDESEPTKRYPPADGADSDSDDDTS
ncbi:MAG: DivIVA domain-containing protein, partial [Oscillospiraceae bacterium]|nr:DivIVA domain-containing protein [Oscillospiraceae bacterium]